ncbi:MAG: DUF479 domain-containing protein [Calditrichia bacterium]|nr:DUF479 domain-containing protein [Calditrichia bacterium]
MNFLAHFYLAENTEESILGNFLGDFVKGPLENKFNPEIQKGIIIHRKVDSFADQHPLFIKSKTLISQPRRRFAGIIIDLCYDHFLAKNWNQFSPISLKNFTQNVYSVLLANNNLFPERLNYFVNKMAAEDWLCSYDTTEGIGKIMDRVSNRLKVKNNLPGSIDELIANYDELEKLFFLFFKELTEFVGNFYNKSY